MATERTLALPLDGYHLIAHDTVSGQQLKYLWLNLRRTQIYGRNTEFGGQDGMKDLLGEVTELYQAAAEAATFRSLIPQGFCQLRRLNRSAGHEHVAQAGKP